MAVGWKLTTTEPGYKIPKLDGGGRPIRFMDPDGMWPDPPRVGVGFNLSVGFSGKKPVFNASVAVGVSQSIGGATANLNVAVNVRSFGLGTTHGSTGSTEIRKELVVSPSVTLGGGEGTPLPLNTMNGNTAAGVTNTSNGAVTIGSNLITSDNGDQRVGYIGYKSENSQFNLYNDFLPVIGNRLDQKNTGGASAQLAIGSGNTITVGADVYTGDKMPLEPDGNGQNRRPTYSEGGIMYNRQTTDQEAFNNGQTYIRVTGPVSGAAAIGGKNMMYPQNGIHALRKEPRFKSTANGL